MAIRQQPGAEVNPYRAREAQPVKALREPDRPVEAEPITKPAGKAKAKADDAADWKPLSPAQIRAARSLLGLSQTAFGAEAGLSRATMSRIEEPREGMPPPTEKALKAISSVVAAHGLIIFDEDEAGGVGVRLPKRGATA